MRIKSSTSKSSTVPYSFFYSSSSSDFLYLKNEEGKEKTLALEFKMAAPFQMSMKKKKERRSEEKRRSDFF
jgi:hypothetical protein